ncbi:MAG: YigZ family protein [Nocardioides sp.]
MSAPVEPTSYRTIARDATAEIEVKRSRFLAQITRVEDEAAAREVVAAARKQHWDARHHCSAFVLGADARLRRSSDDGEPAGTAGAPMLEVLLGRGLSDVVVVVTRWFGGVLLGTGGLVRAYADATAAAADAAGSLHRELVREYAVRVEHAQAGRLEADLRARGWQVLGAEYAAEVTLRVGTTPESDAALVPQLAALTAGAAKPEPVGERWVDRCDAPGA